MSLVQFRKQNTSPAFSVGFPDLDRVFDSMFRNALTNIASPVSSVTDLAVRMDVSETEKSYLIKADLPGMEEKDVNVTLDDGVLTISGEKQSESEEEGKTFHRIERSYGSFRRVLSLPADADENGINAHMENGVLHIEIGKTKQAEKTAKRIDVKRK
ncbi:MAG TPA: Hsp20/alpha crystallin family protein [Alphaproteobacteria bacterium]